jgi:hypothetical protein
VQLRVIGIIAMLVLSVLVVPLLSDAQRPVKVPRIGVLVRRTLPLEPDWRERWSEAPFLQALRALGYIDGHTIAVEYRITAKPEQYPALVAELVRLPVDVIVSGDTLAIRAAKEATTTTPIVMLVHLQ